MERHAHGTGRGMRKATTIAAWILGTTCAVLALRAALHEGEADLSAMQQAIAGSDRWWIGCLPFVSLLACMAILPLVPAIEPWWESNRSKAALSCALGLVALAWIHATAGATAAGLAAAHGAAEYVPFITLLLALYVIAGGVRLEGRLPASTLANTAMLGLGATLANLLGTTGASMLLITPLLRSNAHRRHRVHTVIFFIFLVSNVGGCLLPIGDPPLFLGYLEGVDFLWTLSLWKPWLLVNGLLLAIYWAWDTFFAHPHESARDLARDARMAGALKVSGFWPNAPLMAGVIAAVALLDPSKAFPGTDWHPWIFLREAVLVGLVGLSLLLGSREVRRKNGFTYGAILEVAALFVGIFICMQPALAILNERGASLGIESPRAFFWATGSLSSVLDNAPTYLVFFKTAQAMPSPGETMAGVDVARLAAISLGAVFLGAMTYIGNGPNFMVKAIAEQAGVKMPSFFGYVLYSLGVLLPVFLLMAFLFF